MWIGLLASVQVLLPSQIESMDPENKVWALGLVTTIAAVAAMVSSAIGGALSDRTTWRFGRRRSWVVAGAALCTVALFALPWQSSVLGVGVSWVIVHASVNGMHAALCAAVPDRVPVNRRGLVSAITGTAQPIGLVVGTFLVAGLSTRSGYLLVAILVPILTVPYALTGGLIVASVAAGRMSDRVGRRKVFVIVSSLVTVAGLITMALVPVWAAAIFAAISLGAGYGAYFTIDQAMVTQIPSRARDRGKDLGVMNMAGTGAVALASLVAAGTVTISGYSTLFLVAALLAAAGGLFVLPIKSVS